MKNPLLRIVHFSIENPRKVMALTVVITVILLTQLPGITVDTDPENMLPADEPVRLAHREIKKEFSLYDSFVVGVVDDTSEEGVFRPETLERIARITDEILKIDGVVAKDVISPLTTDDIQAVDGVLTIEPLMGRRIPDQETAERIRGRALENPILKNLLVSGDGKAVNLFVPIKEKKLSYRVAKEIESIVERHGGGEEYYITGLPVVEETFGVEMFRQMGVSAPLAGLLIFLLMLFFFRSVVLVASSMVVAMITVIWIMGFLVGTGFTVHIMSSMIPIFLMPIAVLDSIHILSEFSDRFPSVKDKKETLLMVMKELFTPMLFTSITSAAGFASLVLTPIPPVRVFGGFVAAGIAVAWLLTMAFIPAYIMLLPERFLKRLHRRSKGSVLYRAQEYLGWLSVRHARGIAVVCLVVFAVSVYGITKTRVNDNPTRWFHEGHPLRVAERVLNKLFGGTYMAYLVVEGRDGVMKTPGMLEYVDRLQGELSSLDVVGKTTSVVDVVKKISFELNDEDPAYNRVPDTSRKVAQYLFLYEMTGDPDDLYHLVDPGYSKLNVWIQLRRGDNQDMKAVEAFVYNYMRDNPPPAEVETKWAGLTYLNVVWQEKMVRGMLKSLAGGGVVVFLMMVFIFRSPLWGFISIVPLSITIAFIYGLIGMVGKDYDMPVAVLSSLTLGISVDFAIHLLQRTRQIRRESATWEETVERVFDEPVRAIIRNMVVISMGFAPLFFSPLVPYQTVGFFFAAIMAVSGLTTLLVLPALMVILRRPLKL